MLTQRARVGFAVTGTACLAIAVLGGVASPGRFFQSYLIGYTFWLGLALGCLGLALVHSVTGGAWGLLTRPIFESGAATLPLLALLFIPVLVGIPTLYPWTHTSDFKSLYLNVPFFVGRAVVYFVCWIAISRAPRRWSVPGLLVLPVTASFAAIDWWMSLEPQWFSTMYPVLTCIGALLTAMAFATLLITLFGPRVTPGLLNDLGSLLLAFVMLWAYMTYFQYMLIWSGNLKDEITWYVRRADGAWLPVAWSVAVLGFLVPFSLLLFRGLKRNPRWLAAVAALVVAAHVLEVYWVIEPAFSPALPVVDWRWPLVWVGVGALWLALFTWRLAAAPLDPADRLRLAELAEAARAAA